MLHITTTSHLHHYTCKPKTKQELYKIIIQRIEEDDLECDLNDIDVSKITDMSYLFNANHEVMGNTIFTKFNCDISRWDVSNVKNMKWMFSGCVQFNCDLSDWDVSNVEDMRIMFNGCEKFNCDISRWDVSKVKDMETMFYGCTAFNQDIDNWNVSNVRDMYNAFEHCSTQPKWYNKWIQTNIITKMHFPLTSNGPAAPIYIKNINTLNEYFNSLKTSMH